jgi:glyoxylate/hydroxypyruvate reductase A
LRDRSARKDVAMAILCRLHEAYGTRLIEGIRASLPQEDVREWPDIGDPDDIDICIVFHMQPGFLKPFRNLGLISATGAGIDHYLLDPDLPRHVPLVRIVDADFAARMADYVLCWVLFHHREVAHCLASQRQHRWAYKTMRSAGEVRVGVMGLGQMGRLSCERLAAIGYAVRAWSRTRHAIDGVDCYAGEDEFGDFLGNTEILVNLLPLTPRTAGILGKRSFDRLPAQSVVISAAHGGHLVEADLLEALASERLRAATIDAFPIEPLPSDHPFWDHPKIYVTPHCSSTASLETTINSFAENVRRFRAGEGLLNRVDFAAGY